MRDVVPLLILVSLSVGDAHVALTFPEARYPALDFLDTTRTMGPCGVPKPRKAHYTNLLAGEHYNITWRMQYPHQGGYRIVLADESGNTVEQLAPINGTDFAGTDNQIAQSRSVHITRPCQHCIIIFERQAIEWGTSFLFRSCGDVNILETMSEEDVCNGHGFSTSRGCECNSGYGGDSCQYTTNCHHDGDCLNGGKCMAEPNSIVMASCYCSYGFFGNNCELSFKREADNCFAYEMIDDEHFDMFGMFNSSCYNREKLSEDDFVYYRKVESDVELILDYATTSWVSIGWRPEVIDRSCRLFPDLEGVRSKRSTRVQTQKSSHPQSARHRRDNPPSEANNDEFASNRENPPRRIAQEGPRPTMPRDNGLLVSALYAPLHAMDCIDILIGAVRDGRTRVQDSYSRDRSTPLEDFWYEGEMSLVGAYGRELDGRTIVMFRRPMQEIEPTDHPLGPRRLFVVSAKGQQQGAYSHGAQSALDVGHPTELFYMDDILKYHGSKNRAVHLINFTTPVKPWKFADTKLAINTVTTETSQLSTHGPTKYVTSSSPVTKPTMTQRIHNEVTDSSIRPCLTLFVSVIALIILY